MFYGPHDWVQMTLSELSAYADELGPLQAEWLLDLAQAAAYPTKLRFAPEAATAWWDRLVSLTAHATSAASSSAQKGAAFTLNGVAMTFDRLSAQVSRMLGGGVSR